MSQYGFLKKNSSVIHDNGIPANIIPVFRSKKAVVRDNIINPIKRIR